MNQFACLQTALKNTRVQAPPHSGPVCGLSTGILPHSSWDSHVLAGMRTLGYSDLLGPFPLDRASAVGAGSCHWRLQASQSGHK